MKIDHESRSLKIWFGRKGELVCAFFTKYEFKFVFSNKKTLSGSGERNIFCSRRSCFRYIREI